jgi:ureidoacrylate peracid hydrolase
MTSANREGSRISPHKAIEAGAHTKPIDIHPALVVIDMQNGFCTQGGSYHNFGGQIEKYRRIIPNVKRIIDACHELSIPIFYTQQVREASGIDLLTRRHRIIPKERLDFIEGPPPTCVRGTWDAAIIDELMPSPDDHIVIKRRDSAFQDTEFELWLKSIGADTIIFTGIDTCICVENSFREGFNKGYDVMLIEDAVASVWEDLHTATLQKARGSFGLVLTTEQLIDMLHTARRRASAFRLSTEHLK